MLDLFILFFRLPGNAKEEVWPTWLMKIVTTTTMAIGDNDSENGDEKTKTMTMTETNKIIATLCSSLQFPPGPFSATRL